MKFTCSRRNLQDATNSVIKAVSTNPVMPVLSNIYLKVKDNQIILRAYDNEIGIESTKNAEVYQEGEILVNARLFSDIIRTLGDEEVEINTENNNLVILSGNAVFKIRWLPVDSFPPIPVVDKGNRVQINSEFLKNMIRNTLFSVSSNEQRLILTGALFESQENCFKMVTLDSFRMSIRKEYILGNKEEFKFVIPGKTLSELLKLLTKDDLEINIYYEKTQVLFEFDNLRYVSKLLEGEYFNYSAIIPSDFITTVEFNVEAFKEIVERNMLVSEAGKKAPIVLNIKDNLLTSSTVGESGNVTETLVVKKEGRDINIGFNARYLLDSIKAVEDEVAKICFVGETSACIITPLKSDEYLYLLLPVKIA